VWTKITYLNYILLPYLVTIYWLVWQFRTTVTVLACLPAYFPATDLVTQWRMIWVGSRTRCSNSDWVFLAIGLSLERHIYLKGVMSWPKVSSLVFIFWSLSWTNGPNTQLKWKLRYSPIQCAYLKPSMARFLDRRCNRIGLKLGTQHRAVGVCIDFSAYALMLGKSSRRCRLDL